jgi:glycerol-3-phosphate acyltransferase PlsY
LLAISGWLGLAVLGTWLLMAVVFRYSSLSALVASMAAPVYAMLFGLQPQLVLASAIMSLLLIWRHKSNIINLMTGKESKIGKKKPAADQSA